MPETTTSDGDSTDYPGELSTGSKANGNAAEQWVRAEYDLDQQDPDLYPEHAHDAVDPRTETPIEIKSCQIYYNGCGKRGRFQIWDYAHQDLLEAGGAYIFVVHEPTSDSFHVYLHRPLSAEQVDTLLGNWHAIDHSLRPEDAHRTSLAQSHVFTDIGISRIDPEPQDQGSETASDSEPDTDADQYAGEAPQVERMKAVKQAIRQTAEKHDEDLAPHGAVVEQVVRETDTDPDTVEHHIEQLLKRGEIYMPRSDEYRVTDDVI